MSNLLDNKYQKLDIKRCESAPVIEKTSSSAFRFHRYFVSNADEIKKEWSQNEPSINFYISSII